jgi:hypothetical protein
VQILQAFRVEVKFFERSSPSGTRLTGASGSGFSRSATGASLQPAHVSEVEEHAAQFIASSDLRMCELQAQRVEVLQVGCQRRI